MFNHYPASNGCIGNPAIFSPFYTPAILIITDYINLDYNIPYKDVVGGHVESLAKDKVDNIHCFILSHKSSHFMLEDNQFVKEDLPMINLH